MVSLRELIEYFLYPKVQGYDIPKTLIFSLILILAVYLVYLLLKKLKVKIDYKLAIGIAPYIVFGATVRVLQDAGILDSFLFVTPFIYVFVFGIVFFTLILSLKLEKEYKISYHKPLFLFGLFLASFSIVLLTPVNLHGIILTIAFYLPWLFILLFFKKWSLTNRAVLSVQMFDANVTFVSINFFSFLEQHVLPAFLINLFGPFSFVLTKLIAITIILILIDRFSKNKEFNNYLKLIIGILGASTGTRDFIALATLIG